jgi:hypothetical protein
VLVKCHAGCTQHEVIAALRERGLWPCSERDEWQEWSGWDRGAIRYPAAWGRVVTHYDYSDEDGAYFYSVFRFHPKSFRPGYFTHTGKWTWKKHPRQMLYRLRETLENPIVFLVEGEKDVETLREWGFTDTTAPGGANAPWLPQYTAALYDKEVIVIPDQDEAGWQRAHAVCAALLGKVCRLRLLELPAGCKDVTEFFEKGHSECELIARLEGANAV